MASQEGKWVGTGIGVGTLMGFLFAALIFGLLHHMDGTLRLQQETLTQEGNLKDGRISALEHESVERGTILNNRAVTISQHEATIQSLRNAAEVHNNENQERDRLRATVERQEALIRNGERLLESLRVRVDQLQARVTDLQRFEAEANQLRPHAVEVQNRLQSRDEQVQDLTRQLGESDEKRQKLQQRLDFVKQKVAQKNESEAKMKLEVQKTLEDMATTEANALKQVDDATIAARQQLELEKDKAEREIEAAKREAAEEIEFALRLKNREIEMARKELSIEFSAEVNSLRQALDSKASNTFRKDVDGVGEASTAE